MFILDIKQFEEFDLNRAKQFVNYWSKHYSYDTIKAFDGNEVIHYINELNLGNNLTDQNIKRLLRCRELEGQILQYTKVGKGNSFQYACQYRYAILVT